MKTTMYAVVAGCLLWTACGKSNEPPGQVVGYAPIYQSDSQITDIRAIEPQPIVHAGKIYIKGYDLYQVEVGKGIHVINMKNLYNPYKKTFIKVEGAEEISVLGNLLYTNNYNDLVVINISNLPKIEVVGRMKEAFHISGGDVPPARGYFECVDPNKGSVIGWTQKTLYSPKCKY
jgi:hypothetical protein